MKSADWGSALGVALVGFLCSTCMGASDVTIYNQNLGLVHEQRTFSLNKGINDIRATDVSAQIDPTSVHFKSLSSPEACSVLEQNFEYDLISQDKLLDKYIGKEIELERNIGSTGEKKEVVRGTLLSNQNGRILQAGGKILIDPPGNPILPELPEGLLTRPTLLWKIDAKRSGPQEFDMSYLTEGMEWRADYVLSMHPKEDSVDLNAWVTIDNHSGATFKDARIKLVAGDVHRAPSPGIGRALMMKRADMAQMAAAPQFAEKTFFEYHLYTLGRPSTLHDNETKQIQMASASDVPVEKMFIYDGVEGLQLGDFSDYTRSDPNFGTGSQKKVAVMLEFKNSKNNHLGMPLPGGKIRVYKNDDDGSLVFVGEDSMDHTPKDEKIRVRMGNAFDIVGERARTNFLSDVHRRWFQESFEIKLRNHKDEDVVVHVIEHLYRWNQWKIEDSSQPWRKRDAQTIEFETPVKKDSEGVVTYTVKYSW